MIFERVIGQKRAKAFFESAFASGRLAHAYLLSGQRGVGKEALALEFAKALLCPNGIGCQSESCPHCQRVHKLSHPDLKLIFPAPAKLKEEDALRVHASLVENPYNRLELWANPSISIDRIRELRRVSSFKSYEGKGRAILIFDCERMTNEAANALLKILEEPPDKTYLVLTSSRPNLVLPTISSRCQVVRLDPLSVPEIELGLTQNHDVSEQEAGVVSRLASGSYRRAVELIDEDLQDLQTAALDFFRKSIQNEFTQIMYVDEMLYAFQRDLKKIRDLLKIVAFWFRDAMIFKENDDNGEPRLVNVEQQDVIEKFTKSFPNADLHNAFAEIERSLELMDRNVQINLILIVLLNKLRGYLRRP